MSDCAATRVVTRVAQLSLIAGSAQEAMLKAEVWLKTSGIENAYVSEVCRDGLDEIDIVGNGVDETDENR